MVRFHADREEIWKSLHHMSQKLHNISLKVKKQKYIIDFLKTYELIV